VVERTITKFAEAVEKDRPRERVARFALVEAKTGAPTQLGIAVPAEHEERSFYSADVPQGHRQSVCPGAGLDYPRTFTTSPETTSATAYGYPRRSSRRSAMSVCGSPDTAAIPLPSPMAPPPLRNGGR